ncbi:MAG TPA: hypothetical protein VFO34_11930 [Candidatus Acidoferrales bacterium]|nr:hypothetical protein [Candidatus Acidoferrales bacterium]
MSRIYEELKRAQRERLERQAAEDHIEGERRISPRKNLRVPVFVYGRAGAACEPFHEETTSLEVNASGALVALSNQVEMGQRLHLTNGATHAERECVVVHLGPPGLRRPAIAVAFTESAPDFWESPL